MDARDAAIRARVDEGAADSIVYLLQFGTSFTKRPRISERELAGVVMRQSGSGASRFVPSPLLLSRIEDFIVAVGSPGVKNNAAAVRAECHPRVAASTRATESGQDRAASLPPGASGA